MTQGQLAECAGTSRARLNSYERAQVSPTSDTLERVLGAMGADLTTIPTMTYEERRSLAISESIARKLVEDPDAVISKARSNLVRMRMAATHEVTWIDIWDAILGLGVYHVASLLTATDQFARDLRQSSPFAGVLTEAARAEAIRSVGR